jgi:hypothetical protein
MWRTIWLDKTRKIKMDSIYSWNFKWKIEFWKANLRAWANKKINWRTIDQIIKKIRIIIAWD